MVRILLADDDAALRDLIARGLEKDGHEVVVGLDGTAALEQITQARNSGKGFDLLITDIEMPGMDGISLCEAAVDTLPDLQLLLVSGFAEQLQQAAQLAGGKAHTLLKPFALDDIRAQVAAIMAG